jgi:hypothetical protein
MIDDVAMAAALAGAAASVAAISLRLRERRRKSDRSLRGAEAAAPACSTRAPDNTSQAAKVTISLLPDHTSLAGDNLLAGPLTSAARLIIELVPDRSG